MSTIAESLEQTSINTIRTLAMDAVEAANSGHPGTPMALAPVAYTIVDAASQLRSDGAAVAKPRPYAPPAVALPCCCTRSSTLPAYAMPSAMEP